MSTPTPKPTNPYLLTLAGLAAAFLIVGLAVVMGSQSSGSGYDYDEGSPAGVAVGALLFGSGATLGVAWLAVSALLWTPSVRSLRARVEGRAKSSNFPAPPSQI